MGMEACRSSDSAGAHDREAVVTLGGAVKGRLCLTPKRKCVFVLCIFHSVLCIGVRCGTLLPSSIQHGGSRCDRRRRPDRRSHRCPSGIRPRTPPPSPPPLSHASHPFLATNTGSSSFPRSTRVLTTKQYFVHWETTGCTQFKSLGQLHAGIDRRRGEHVSHVVDLADGSADTSARLQQIMAGADTVVHAAAHPGPSANQPPGPAPGWGDACVSSNTIGLEPVPATQLLVDNLVGSLQIFEAAAACGVSRVVFSSSAFAQGWCHDPVANAPAALPISDADDATPFETCE